jgi:uncharacterized protein (UPF0264 family)
LKHYALSLKQPWATLLVHGLKSIEVRSWPTARRGPILIHAARVCDHRPEAWAKLPLELHSAARLLGGIVGQGRLTDCVSYGAPREFAADQPLHLNDPSWFQPPRLFGFKFAELTPLAFQPCPGWVRFFRMETAKQIGSARARKRQDKSAAVDSAAYDSIEVDRPRLLVSVRSAAEALAALEGEADIIDIKEPSRGSLGRADDATTSAVLDAVAGRKLVSTACGELLESLPLPQTRPPAFVKWGVAGCGAAMDWSTCFEKAAAQLPGACRPVAVAYADWQRAHGPTPDKVSRLACRLRHGVLLIDTWQKDGNSLLNFLSLEEIEAIVRKCREANTPVALAGSLNRNAIERLLPLSPAIIAVRGAVCSNGDRNASLDVERVRSLASLVGGRNVERNSFRSGKRSE